MTCLHSCPQERCQQERHPGGHVSDSGTAGAGPGGGCLPGRQADPHQPPTVHRKLCQLHGHVSLPSLPLDFLCSVFWSFFSPPLSVDFTNRWGGGRVGGGGRSWICRPVHWELVTHQALVGSHQSYVPVMGFTVFPKDCKGGGVGEGRGNMHKQACVNQ